jgi:hypothetical protein
MGSPRCLKHPIPELAGDLLSLRRCAFEDTLMESTSVTKAMIRIGSPQRGQKSGKVEGSAPAASPEIAGTGRRLGVGRLARCGRGRVHAPRGRSLHREAGPCGHRRTEWSIADPLPGVARGIGRRAGGREELEARTVLGLIPL